MAYIEERRFSFTSSALPEDTFSVVNFKGIEGISRLYEFEITLVSSDSDIDIDTVLRNSVTFSIHREEKDTVFHGIAAYFEQLHEVDEQVFYRTLLVPRLWLSDQQHENQLFLDKTVPDIIEEILQQAGLTSLDYEFKLTRNYRPWEYICQYRETDFDFISRWMEREGIYYFFEQTDTGEKIIITDNSTVHQELPDDSTIYYSPPSALVSTEEEEIREFICRQTRLPQKVLLKDYNYRKPSLEIRGEAMVDPNSRGIVYLYGEHFKTPEEGNELARIRAEEILCREKVFFGEGTATSMRAGYLFELADHYRDSCNQQYLIVEVEHEGSQAGFFISGVQEESSEEEGEIVYRNKFMVIPADVQFRPERKTEKPRFHGTINAKIDAAGDGQYAEIDEWGRYKVVLPFDMTGKGGGRASRWIRMAQPYSGQGFGMHFPLHKGTEVLLTFVDGDPDRPIIAGSVPNPETMSPVTGDNHSQCVIRTGGGNEFQLEDSSGGQRIRISTPHSGTTLSMGAPNSPGAGFSLNTTADLLNRIGGDTIYFIDGSKNIKIQKDKSETIVGCERKTTIGACSENFYGNKVSKKLATEYEVTVGTKTSVCAALSFDLKFGHFATRAPTEYELKWFQMEKKADLKKDIGKLQEKIGSVDKKIELLKKDVTSWNLKITSAKEKIDQLDMDIGSLRQKINSARVQVSGTYQLKASTVSIKGSSARLALGGEGATLQGNPVRIKGSQVKVKGNALKIT